MKLVLLPIRIKHFITPILSPLILFQYDNYNGIIFLTVTFKAGMIFRRSSSSDCILPDHPHPHDEGLVIITISSRIVSQLHILSLFNAIMVFVLIINITLHNPDSTAMC